MKVRLFHTLPGERRTSMEVYARELAKSLRQLESGAMVEDWCPNGHLRDAVARWPLLARMAGYADRYAVYQWQVRHQDADVNHVVDHGYGHLAFSLNPRRTVVSFHDAMLLKLEAHELSTPEFSRFTSLGHKLSLRAIRHVARVIAPSESARFDLLRFTDYPTERVRVVPLGVSPQFHPVGRDDRSGTRSHPARILHVGHCAPYKNVESILRVLPLVERRLGEHVTFVKVGAAFTSSQQRLAARLGIHSRVEHLGFVPLAELPRVYSAADVLLMPSLYEGFGLPALEAMACGTPVVASRAGSLPEVVGDATLLVEPTDLEGIADAVTRALTDTALRVELRRRGLARAAEFTWQRTARQTLAVYHEVCEESR